MGANQPDRRGLTRTLLALATGWTLLGLAACAAVSPSPTPVPTAVPSPTPRSAVVRISEDELGEWATAAAQAYTPIITGVTANVQSDDEVYWRLKADLYRGDTMAKLQLVMGSSVRLEEGQVRFHVFWMQWIGSQPTLDRLPESLRNAILELEGYMTERVNARLLESELVPQDVDTDDVALIVTLGEP